jgi:hypothetical protein
MDRCFACLVDSIRVRLAQLKKSVDDEWISSQDSLVEGQCAARVDLRFAFLEDHVHNAEVHVAAVG